MSAVAQTESYVRGAISREQLLSNSKGGIDAKHVARPRRVLVRTPTPSTTGKRQVGPWVSVKLAPNDRMFAQFKTGCSIVHS
jgi:hypothetical protein